MIFLSGFDHYNESYQSRVLTVYTMFWEIMSCKMLGYFQIYYFSSDIIKKMQKIIFYNN